MAKEKGDLSSTQLVEDDAIDSESLLDEHHDPIKVRQDSESSTCVSG